MRKIVWKENVLLSVLKSGVAGEEKELKEIIRV